MIQFRNHDHSYTSIVPDDTRWLSVTAVVSTLKPVFDPHLQAAKSTKNRKSKWYGIPVPEIIAAWEGESKRSLDVGHWYHDRVERQILSQDSYEGLPVHRYKTDDTDTVKIAPDQKLAEGIYPEHMVYLQSTGICGQSDIVRVQNGIVHITDHKTSKEIRTEGYKNWEGITTKMQKPMQHLDDCEYNHYGLQLSLYLYIVLRHNPLLMPGTMTINHVRLKESSKDKYGYPVHQLIDGEPVIESITPIVIPYMHHEAQAIINWIKEPKNR
jgi:hypothetical protein